MKLVPFLCIVPDSQTTYKYNQSIHSSIPTSSSFYIQSQYHLSSYDPTREILLTFTSNLSDSKVKQPPKSHHHVRRRTYTPLQGRLCRSRSLIKPTQGEAESKLECSWCFQHQRLRYVTPLPSRWLPSALGGADSSPSGLKLMFVVM